MKYYEMTDDLYRIHGRWFLKGINIVDEKKISLWKFVKPERVDVPIGEKLVIAVRENGVPLDFTFADFDVPIINEKVAYFLSENECQLIPVDIDGIYNDHKYFICVILNCIECLDESRSKFEKFAMNDPVRPDKAGQYRAIYELFIDSKKINDERMFRLKNATSTIIVNENLKQNFVKSGITGVKFKEVG